MSGDEISQGYQDRWVAVMDIIGYKERVRRAVDSGTGEEAVRDLRAALDLMGMFADPDDTQPYGHDDRTRILSDTVCVTGLKSGDHTRIAFLQYAAEVVALLAIRGVFVRGGIECGRHFDDGRVLFSAPLIEAYRIESEEAFYPRVLLAPRVSCIFEVLMGGVPLSGQRGEPQFEEVWRDADRRLFLNYLNAHHHLFRGDVSMILRPHKESVQSALLEAHGNPRHRAKHAWTAAYHNTFCRHTFSGKVLDELLIPDAPETGPGPLPWAGPPGGPR